MSTVENLRRFVIERLTAAAEEIFVVVEDTVIEYEKEIERQRILLNIVYKPEVKLHRIDDGVCNEGEGLTEQPLGSQERTSGVDQEDPEPPHIKEEQEEIFSSPDGEQFVPDQEEDALTSDPACEDSPQLMDSGDSNPEEYLPEPAIEAPPQSKSKPHGCTVCEKSYASKGQLIIHKRSHDEKKPYSCSFCGKEFSQRRHLTFHEAIHTGEKQFSCSTCGKKFIRQDVLRIHMRIHTGEKRFFCSTCGRGFTSSSHYRGHLKIHTGERPYGCDTCGKRFMEQRHLRDHLRIHTGEKPFSCSTCGKSFSQQYNLKVHVRTHTGEKPFSCCVCEKSFSRQNDLKRHMKTHM